MDELTTSQVLDLCGFAPDVLDLYDLEVIEAAPVRKVVRFSTPYGRYALKKFNLTPAELHFSLAAMEHVKANGFAVPGVVKTRQGDLYAERNGACYFVMEWLNGRESKYDHVLDLALAARGLARFHLAAQGFEPPDCAGKEQWGTWTGHFLERIGELRDWTVLAEQGGSVFDRMFAEQAAYCIQEASRSVELLLSSRYEEITKLERGLKGFCHHDYAHHNVLITGDKNISLIDFDYALCDIRAHDLASLILRNMKSVKWDSRTAYFIVKSYFEEAKPHEGEERLLHAMMRFPQDFYEAGYFHYVTKNRPQEHLESKLRKWTEQKERRERFLGEFEAGARYVLKYGKIR
ncbi:CotS family spore coat protein [Tumebacillus sp. BK434]|uniref:CotS family spore coat protein n=1 Tax=Tumebacillus sp. BK434 TaxID=2512169 RepID=UPI0010525DBD|nr:CotS family spore coat protein [Tumebacillus sp. BK434]TCP54786.1 CotS family spore coat protein [Tumebacillus sp. BK434]